MKWTRMVVSRSAADAVRVTAGGEIVPIVADLAEVLKTNRLYGMKQKEIGG